MRYYKLLFSLDVTKSKKTAIVTKNEIINYCDLINAAKSIAFQIQAFNNNKNEMCIIVGRKSICLYQCFLACLLTNFIYTPINVDAGIERNKKLIEIANARYVFLTDADPDMALNLLSHGNAEYIFVLHYHLYVALSNAITSSQVVYINAAASYSDEWHFKPKEHEIAYVMFTSGSTGLSKAVPISYLNLHTYLNAIHSIFSFQESDRVIQLSDMAFDLSIHEILVAFLNGAALYAYDEKVELSLASFIYHYKITHGYFVPSAIPALRHHCEFYQFSLPSLKKIFVCGEIFPLSYARELEKIAPTAAIYNLYGPTEATIACAYHLYRRGAEYHALCSVPMGFPFPGTYFKLTNQNELLISGQQRFSGYWYSNPSDVDCYATGDMVSFDPDWGYIFHGRNDDQWQIKGIRLERNEIEAVLRDFFNCAEIYLVPVYNEAQLIDHLVSFSLNDIKIDYFKQQLQSFISLSAIPTACIKLHSIPKTPNGKINYRLLKNLANTLCNYQFYVEQSVFSDPGNLNYLFLNLPVLLPDLIETVGNWYLHYNDLDHFQLLLPRERYQELDLRYIFSALQLLMQKSSIALLQRKNHNAKILGICRDNALMLCSILRSRGIPARLRVGFNAYYLPGFFLDGFYLQCFDVNLMRWRSVDPRTTQSLIEHHDLTITFDLTDLPENQLISATAAWKGCRLGLFDPNHFGTGLFRGLNYMRIKVIQDFLLLNKQELLMWDCCSVWSDETALSNKEIDDLAEFIEKYADDVVKIRDFYQSNPIFHLPDEVLVANPFLPERYERLERSHSHASYCVSL